MSPAPEQLSSPKERLAYKWKVLISLRETKHRGDIIEFRIRRKNPLSRNCI